MRQLGLIGILLFGFACKAAPEPAPAETSAPVPPGALAAPAAASGPSTFDTASPPGAPAAPADAAGSAPKTYAEGTKNIGAKVGERFAVALPSNITIPLKWRLDPVPDAKVVALVGEKHFDQPPAGCDGCTGYGGTRVFTFEMKGTGKTTLAFLLKPLTDPGGKTEKSVQIELTSVP